MPAKHLDATMVYLPPKVKATYQRIADEEEAPISAVLRRELIRLEKKLRKR